MPRWFDFLLIFGVMGLLPACSEEPQSTATGNRPPPAVREEGPPAPIIVTPAIDNRHATPTVLLLPYQPTARDCPQVIVQGQLGHGEYRWFINGMEVPEQTGNRLCDSKLKRGDQVEVQVAGAESRAAVTIVNSRPRIIEVGATSGQALQRGDIKVKAVIDDPDGDVVALRYQWLINGEADPFSTTETLSGERYIKGDSVQIQITPNDGIEDGESYTSVALPIPNAPPKITSEPTEKLEDREYVYQVTASDPDDEELTYRLEEAPPGMTISDAGRIHWSTSDLPAGTYSVTIAVEDPAGAKTTQQFSMSLEKPRQ